MKHNLVILLCCTVLMMGGITASLYGQSYQKESISNVGGCAQSLSWKIGEIDTRFDIDPQAVKKLMRDVAELWSAAAEEQMIAYSDSGQVTLNFIYGRGQKFTDNERTLSKRIDRMRLHHFALEQNYRQLSTNYYKKLETYNTMLLAYTDVLNKYNLGASRLSKTGVIEGEKNKELEELKKKIYFLEKKLEPQKNTLNDLAKKMERLSNRLNDNVDQINKFIFQYQDQFGSAKTFHQGMYIETGDQRKINIYQFDDIEKLRLVLAHEAGHALGLKHLDNPESIMYYLMEKQDEEYLQPTEEDMQAIAKKCSDLAGTINRQ